MVGRVKQYFQEVLNSLLYEMERYPPVECATLQGSFERTAGEISQSTQYQGETPHKRNYSQFLALLPHRGNKSDVPIAQFLLV